MLDYELTQLSATMWTSEARKIIYQGHYIFVSSNISAVGKGTRRAECTSSPTIDVRVSCTGEGGLVDFFFMQVLHWSLE